MKTLNIILLSLVSIAVGYALSLNFYSYDQDDLEEKPYEKEIMVQVYDTVYIYDTIYKMPYIDPIEIPHPEHGRVIIDLNDTTIIYTAEYIIYNQLDSFQQINQLLFQEFGGRYINRKGK